MADDSLTTLADMILDLRKVRSTALPSELFGGEQGWEILLALFVADGRGDRLTGAMVLAQIGGFDSTGRRWIQHLTKLALIVGDGVGDLNDTLTLTPRGLDALESWLSRVDTAAARFRRDA